LEIHERFKIFRPGKFRFLEVGLGLLECKVLNGVAWDFGVCRLKLDINLRCVCNFLGD
jgi:hypothetical protein